LVMRPRTVMQEVSLEVLSEGLGYFDAKST
jgi:hypothetical protein